MSVGTAGYAAAFAGGIVSFLSPCVLPIVPPYLSLITGLDVAQLRTGGRIHLSQILRQTGLFIAGFSAVFIGLGLSATSVGKTLAQHQNTLTRVSGLIVLAMALYLLVSLVMRVPVLDREARFHPKLAKYGAFAAPVAGAAFGFGWTPCIGPVLASVLAVAATQDEAAQGGLLLTAYSLGLAVPFVVTGLAYGRMLGVFGWVRRHTVGVTVTSGVLMAAFGVLLALDQLTWVTSQLQNLAATSRLDLIISLG